MSTHHATIRWFASPGEDFAKGQYSRAHNWKFDGLTNVAASASPHIVPMPWANPDAVDPEEAFVASLSSCHMLWFLSIAGKRGFVIDSYKDEASGIMGRNDEGRLAMLEVVLKPAVVWSGARTPSAADVAAMHDEAHHECFIANSVRTTVRCEVPDSKH